MNAEQEPSSASFAAWLHDYFRALRFNSSHHLGVGDIRLTAGQQDDLVVAAERANANNPNSNVEPKSNPSKLMDAVFSATPKPCPLCAGPAHDQGHGILCNQCGLWLGNGTQVKSMGGYMKVWNGRVS